MKVPTLEQLRAMTDTELLKLRTEISYDNSVIEGQRLAFEHQDEEWERRAGIAAQVHQRGLAAIKNILVERGSEHRSERDIPLLPWMVALLAVYAAARNLLEDDEDDDNWAKLEAAVEAVEDYGVTHSFVYEAVNQ